MFCRYFGRVFPEKVAVLPDEPKKADVGGSGYCIVNSVPIFQTIYNADGGWCRYQMYGSPDYNPPPAIIRAITTYPFHHLKILNFHYYRTSGNFAGARKFSDSNFRFFSINR